MRSDAWTDGRSESAKAEDERKAEIELARNNAIECGLTLYRNMIDKAVDNGAEIRFVFAFAKLEELTR